MSRLITSALAIYRWLGAAPLRRSDNLKLPDTVKAHKARLYWKMLQDGGGNDAP